MKKGRIAVIGVTMAMAIVGLIVVLGASSDDGAPFLPGVTVTDEHPDGCVDCHKNAGEGHDYRLNVSLRSVEGHPDITNLVKTLPDDCAMCHRASTPAGPLNLITHKDHYRDPSENHFITGYQGACLNCHSVDAATGEMTMKSGAKNW